MTVLVSGSTGLVGSALVSRLSARGDRVLRLVRSQAGGDGGSVLWNPETGAIERKQIENCTAVVHLAGEGIANRRWSAEQKAKIRNSRVIGTQRLCESLVQLSSPPRVLVCASAIGIYGDRGDVELDEQSSDGAGFLAEVCREWEAASAVARNGGIRVVLLRIGIVLASSGGALAKMLTPFRLGLGGRIGSGRQYMSWISIDDVVGAILHSIDTIALQGPVNATAPEPVTNYEFTKTLGRVLRRPTIFPMPAFAARLAFGELANELLLAGARVKPVRLQTSGYHFQCPTLEQALRHELKRRT